MIPILTSGVWKEILTPTLLPDKIRLVDGLEVFTKGGVLDRHPELFAVLIDVLHEWIHVVELDR